MLCGAGRCIGGGAGICGTRAGDAMRVGMMGMQHQVTMRISIGMFDLPLMS